MNNLNDEPINNKQKAGSDSPRRPEFGQSQSPLDTGRYLGPVPHPNKAYNRALTLGESKAKFKTRFVVMVLLLSLIIIALAVGLFYLSHQKIEPDYGLIIEDHPGGWLDQSQVDVYQPKTEPVGETVVWPWVSPLPVLHQPIYEIKDKSKVGFNLDDPDFKSKQLLGWTVFVDAGHGGRDPGTIWPHNYEDYEFDEKTTTLAIAQYVKTKLEAQGAKAILTRAADESVSIYSRPAMVGEYILKDYLDLLAKAEARGETLVAPATKDELNGLLPELQRIIEVNEDRFGGFLSGIGASRQARLLMEVERQYKDCIFLSIHVNSSTAPTLAGSRAYILRSNYLYYAQNIPPELEFTPAYKFMDVLDPKVAEPKVLTPSNEDAGAAANNLATAKGKTAGEASASQPLPVAKNPQGPTFYPLYLNFNDQLRLRLGRNLYHQVVATVPELTTSSGGTVLDENFAVLRVCNIPGVLFETGFITNTNDRELLWQDDQRQLIAEGLVRGIISYATLTEEYGSKE